jgi:hypothetical protein
MVRGAGRATITKARGDVKTAHPAAKAALLEQFVQEMIRLADRAPLPTAMA